MEKASRLVEKLLKRNQGKSPIPDIAQVAAKFVEFAGGPENMAKLLWKEWQAAGEGSPVRQKLIDLVLRSMKGADSRLGENSLSELTDAELENILAETLHREAVSPNAATPAEDAGPAARGDAPAPQAEGRPAAAPADQAP